MSVTFRTKFTLVLASLLAWCPTVGKAVYAPIPEQEQGKAWTVSLRSAYTYDTNIFGSAENETASSVFTAQGKAAFNASLAQRTFASAYYQATLDHYTERPGSKDLASHELFARLAQSFSPVSTLDLADFFQRARNPQSLLAGLPLNTDQSLVLNQFDGSYRFGVTPKATGTVKYRNSYYNYDNETLGRGLDRMENLFGVSGSYALLPELGGVLEYRRREVGYAYDGGTKDKHSDYLLAGADYRPTKRLALSGRAGVEWRSRESERSITSPSAELSAKYDLGKESYLAAGYAFALEESSDVVTYTDTQVNRFFVNLQKALTGRIVGSLSLTYEPSVLKGRRGVSDCDETTVRGGAGLRYLPTKNWTVSADYDVDKVDSDVAAREMLRNRVSFSGSYVF